MFKTFNKSQIRGPIGFYEEISGWTKPQINTENDKKPKKFPISIVFMNFLSNNR